MNHFKSWNNFSNLTLGMAIDFSLQVLIKGTQYENCFDFRFRFVLDFQSDQRGSYG